MTSPVTIVNRMANTMPIITERFNVIFDVNFVLLSTLENFDCFLSEDKNLLTNSNFHVFNRQGISWNWTIDGVTKNSNRSQRRFILCCKNSFPRCQSPTPSHSRSCLAESTKHPTCGLQIFASNWWQFDGVCTYTQLSFNFLLFKRQIKMFTTRAGEFGVRSTVLWNFYFDNKPWSWAVC